MYKEKLKSEKYQKWNIKWPKKSSKAEDIHNFFDKYFAADAPAQFKNQRNADNRIVYMLQLKDANWLDHENIDLKVKTHDKKMSWTLKMFGITTNDQVSSIFNNIEYQDKINNLQTQRDWSRQHQHVQYYSIENDNSIQFKKIMMNYFPFL